MNKRTFKYTLVIICLFFIGIIPVSAKENCISVKEELEKYDSYTNILNSIDCSDNSNETNVATCNEFNVRKNIIVTKLMKKNDEKSICSSVKNQVNKIINIMESSIKNWILYFFSVNISPFFLLHIDLTIQYY